MQLAHPLSSGDKTMEPGQQQSDVAIRTAVSNDSPLSQST